MLLVSCLLIGVHFLLLEQWTASALAVVAALRFLVSLKTTSKRTMAGFMMLAVIITVITYAGPLSLLTCCGSLFGTAACFSTQDKRLRQLMLIGTSLWLTNNILVGSPMAVLMESLFICSNLLGYYRFYIRPSQSVES